ncbi:LysR family transcriptional regulator [Paractinoplanes ferrugineus]|uniref:LysR family transcriptional regulator n=1 Tax=Paractinoplanes ferrugineus TaxID=113564 RepID=A0A919IYL9_9ACTN|nr:LysR family transcriptional regulator [Actinoplanes ferrugineus]GIE10559.1 LysR family transcriptional regulator [Actinoplanes ferrugineus]
MSRILGIATLRSFVAVADCGGFQRAATALHLTQGAVSQHVRRLESTLGRALVERDGRGSRFTTAGETLLTRARRILAAHDETLLAFDVEPERHLVVGTTEHAASRLLPALAGAFPGRRVRFRIDRGAQLRTALAEGRVDLALLISTESTGHRTAGPGRGGGLEPGDKAGGGGLGGSGLGVGELPLTWYSAPHWRRPTGDGPVPLVAFDAPCALRSRALDTLAEHGLPAELGCEAAHLAGVQAAVRAGLGVALMAGLEEIDGLVARDDLPPARPLALSVQPRAGLPAELADSAAEALRALLTTAPRPVPAGDRARSGRFEPAGRGTRRACV